MLNLIYNKYDATNASLGPEIRTVLDVGCRDAILKKHLSSGIKYTGLDLMEGPGVDHVCNVEKGLPFGNGEFDVVVALDLLEHTDNIWFVFDELARVARRKVIVLLPNSYHWSFRLQYLLGKEMGKYILPPEPILDRHRWLLSHNSARRFCLAHAEKGGWHVTERILFGGRRTLPIDWILSPLSKNAAAWATLFVFDKAKR